MSVSVFSERYFQSIEFFFSICTLAIKAVTMLMLVIFSRVDL